VWINQYYAHHQSQIVQEVQAMNQQEKEPTDEEIAYWIDIGKKIFKENFEYARNTGYCVDLSQWGSNWFNKFQEKGMLKPWEYPVEEIEKEARRDLRLTNKWIDETSVLARSRNKIWKLFILESVKNNIKLDELI